MFCAIDRHQYAVIAREDSLDLSFYLGLQERMDDISNLGQVNISNDTETHLEIKQDNMKYGKCSTTAEFQPETEHGATGKVSTSTYQVSMPPVTEEEACSSIDEICIEWLCLATIYKGIHNKVFGKLDTAQRTYGKIKMQYYQVSPKKVSLI